MKHICFAISSLHCGGSERVLTTLANGFANKNYKVSIVLVSVSSAESFYKLNDGISIIPLLKSKKKTNFFKRVIQLNRLFKRIKPDVVISFLSHISIYCYFALKRQKIPLICSERNDPHQYKKITRKLLKHCFRKSSGNVFQTDDAKAFYKNANNPIVIPNPVFLSDDVLNFKPTKEKFFISVGRLEKQKRFDLLIKAFHFFRKDHPDFMLRIYGDGSLKNDLNRYISACGENEYISIKPSNSGWHYEAKKAIAFISTSDFEGMPNALEEALCLGCYCIATDCPIGGSKYLMQKLKNGKLIPSDNLECIVGAMKDSTNVKQNIIINYDFLKPNNILKVWEIYIDKFFQC